MAKTRAQLEKQKREAEKRKKLEKTILKLAAAMPEETDPPAPPPAPKGTSHKS